MKRAALFCKAALFGGFPEFIRRLNGHPAALFCHNQLDMSYIAKGDNFYDWEKACQLVEHAALELDEPSLGLKWSQELGVDFLNLGPMVIMAAMMPTFRDFLDLAIAYQKLHTNGVAYSYVPAEDPTELEFEIRAHPLSPPCRQLVEHMMGAIFKLESHWVDTGLLKRVTFQHNAPADTSLHEAIFKCPVTFNAPKTAVYAEARILDLKLGGRLKNLRPIVKMYLARKQRIESLFETSIARTIEDILPTLFGMRKSGLADVAFILEISPKKLQRLLRQENVTFSEVRENVKRGMVTRLLMESDIAITHLAVLLDYSCNEALNTACKRWFNQTPREYRKQLRAMTLSPEFIPEMVV